MNQNNWSAGKRVVSVNYADMSLIVPSNNTARIQNAYFDCTFIMNLLKKIRS